MNWFRASSLLLLITSSIRADDWPQWLGPRRDGSTTEKVAPWKSAPKAAWRVEVDKGFSAPVVAQGRVFVHAPVKDKSQEELIAIDAVTGKILWRDSYDRAFVKGPGRGPRATPAVAGKRVFSIGGTGILSAHDTEKGTRLWQVDTYKSLGQTPPRFGVCSSPIVVGNVVLVSVGGKGSCLAAFDTDKGELLWKNYDEPASTSSPVLVSTSKSGAAPDVLFMTTLRLLAVNPLDGSTSWEYPLIFQPGGASTTPLVVGDRVITSTMTNGSTAIQTSGESGKANAKQAWQNKELTGYFSTGVADKQHFFALTNIIEPTPSVALRCVDLASGKELWSKNGFAYYSAGLVRMGDNRLLALDDAGNLKLIDANPTEYRELATAKVCGGTFTVPAVSNGRVYVRDDTELICLEFVD